MLVVKHTEIISTAQQDLKLQTMCYSWYNEWDTIQSWFFSEIITPPIFNNI